MTNSMKSFACFVTGIALIALVVPIQYALAQGTIPKLYCKHTAPNTPQTPATVFCDHSKGDCNEKNLYIHVAINECLWSGAEYAGCVYWMGPSYMKAPIVFNDQGIWAYNLGLTLGAAVVCYIYCGTGVTGLVTAVLCAGTVYALTEGVNACEFGATCPVDWTATSPGPDVLRCWP